MQEAMVEGVERGDREVAKEEAAARARDGGLETSKGREDKRGDRDGCVDTDSDTDPVKEEDDG